MTRTFLSMQIVVLTISVLFSTSFTSPASARERRKNRTQLERFFSEKGSIVVIESQDVGRVFKSVDAKIILNFEAVVLYLPGRDDKVMKGIRITLKGGRTTRKEIMTAFIDSSEIPSLYSALLYILKTEKKVRNNKKNIHITYVTKGDFSVGLIHQKGGTTDFYYRISHDDGGTTSSVKIHATYYMLRQIRKNIKRAVKYLNRHHKKIRKPKSDLESKKELNT